MNRYLHNSGVQWILLLVFLTFVGVGCAEEVEDIKSRPPAINIDISGDALFLVPPGFEVTDGNIDDTPLALWLSSFEEIFTDTPGSVTFLAEERVIETGTSQCERGDLGVVCPFTYNADISLGVTMASRVEDPRGPGGNWLTTFTPLLPNQERLNSLRADPRPAVLEQGPVVFHRLLLPVLAAVFGKDPVSAEKTGMTLFAIQQDNADGSVSALAGVTLEENSRYDYHIVYANADTGLPDTTLTSTTESGFVWIVPKDDKVELRYIPLVLTAADGRTTELPLIMRTNAITVFGGSFPFEPEP